MKPLILCALLGTAALASAGERLIFAEGLARRGLTEQAKTEYEAALAAGEATGEAEADLRLRLAECCEKLAQHDAALVHYRKAIDLASGARRTAAQLRLAKLLLALGKAEEARPLLELAVTGGATGELAAAARFLLGQCYEALGRSQDAATLYRLLADEPGDYAQHARLALAEIAAKAGQTAEAVARYRQAIAAAPAGEAREQAAARALATAYAGKDYAAAAAFARESGEKTLASVQLLIPAAWAALRADLPEEARGWLAADETAHPTPSPERLVLAGAVAEALGDSLGAITAYERIVGEFPNAAQAPFAAEAMLRERAKAGKPELFLKAYTRVAALLKPETALLLAPLRLDAALQVRDLAAARAAAAKLIDHGSPEAAADASYRLGWLAQEEKDWAGAGETWLRAAERWPQAPTAARAAYAAAYAFTQAQLPDRAEVALRLALAANDPAVVPEALMLKARIALSERDTAGAATTLDEYRTRFPRHAAAAEAAYLRGLLFFNAQDFAAAERCLAEALATPTGEGSPTPLDHTRHVDAALRRAQALHALGRGEEAAALLQPLLGLRDAQSLSPAYLRWLAEFQLDRHAWAEAEAAARTMSAHPQAQLPDRVLALVLLGRAAEGAGRTASALAAYGQALATATQPTAYDAQAALGAGLLHLREGNAAKAQQALTLALTRAAGGAQAEQALRGRAYAALGAAEEALGNPQAALKAYMHLIIFYDDPALVPEAFRGAIALLEREGRTREAETLRAECRQRYGTSPQAPEQ